MVIRACLLAGLAAGCYSPSLPECVVECARADDCAPGQTCGSDGLCATPELAGRCDQLDQPDARPPQADADDGDPPDARVDANVPPDAVVAAILRVEISGRGKVKVGQPVDEDCNANDEDGKTCLYEAPVGVSIALMSMDGHGWEFSAWTGCEPASAPTCVVTVGPGTTTVGALFVDD